MKNYLDDILAISGQGGLFKLISNAQGKNNIIVESLGTKKRIPIFSSTNVSTLKDVSIYTNEEDVKLQNVLETIFEKYNGQKVLSEKPTNPEYFNFMEEVLPDYNKEKVYASDIRKLVNWYNALIDNQIISKEAIEEARKIAAEEEAKKAETETETETETEKAEVEETENKIE